MKAVGISLAALLAELAGTALLIGLGLGAVRATQHVEPLQFRLLLNGSAFAAVVVAVVYSPLGRTSGAHLNPAVTLAFWRLGMVRGREAAAYVVAQTAGALLGALPLELAGAGRPGLTLPGDGVPVVVAFAAEVAATWALLAGILRFLAHRRLAPFAGLAAAALIVVLVVVEAPVSGASLNPARSAGPALDAGLLSKLWIYLAAPPLGALAAATRRRRPRCAKLFHRERDRCPFSKCACNGRGEVAVWPRAKSTVIPKEEL